MRADVRRKRNQRTETLEKHYNECNKRKKVEKCEYWCTERISVHHLLPALILTVLSHLAVDKLLSSIQIG
jgi:hypothetical protein